VAIEEAAVVVGTDEAGTVVAAACEA